GPDCKAPPRQKKSPPHQKRGAGTNTHPRRDHRRDRHHQGKAPRVVPRNRELALSWPLWAASLWRCLYYSSRTWETIRTTLQVGVRAPRERHREVVEALRLLRLKRMFLGRSQRP